jgi:hypothetical protein
LEICSFLHIPCSTAGEGYVSDQAVGEPNENGMKPLELTLLSSSDKAAQAREKKSEAEANKAKRSTTQQDTKKSSTRPSSSAKSTNTTNAVNSANSSGKSTTR